MNFLEMAEGRRTDIFKDKTHEQGADMSQAEGKGRSCGARLL